MADVRLRPPNKQRPRRTGPEGSFREDLTSVAVVEILLPDYANDRGHPLLAPELIKEFARENNKKVTSLAPEAMDLLRSYSWPGNVRELRSAIESAVVLCRTDRHHRAGSTASAAGPRNRTASSGACSSQGWPRTQQ